jgi:hypothetical protein
MDAVMCGATELAVPHTSLAGFDQYDGQCSFFEGKSALPVRRNAARAPDSPRLGLRSPASRGSAWPSRSRLVLF